MLNMQFSFLTLFICFCCFSLNSTEIYVLRHGQAEHNIQHLMSSVADVSLTEKGKLQVQASAEALAEKASIDLIFCSPLERTQQTAAIAANALGYPVDSIIIDYRLREQYYGSYEWKPYEEYVAQFTKKDHEFILGAPDGEWGSELYERIAEFLDNLLENPDYWDKNILIVTHAYPLCQISKYFTGRYDEIPQTGEWKHFSH